jgi:hypothetical protein
MEKSFSSRLFSGGIQPYIFNLQFYECSDGLAEAKRWEDQEAVSFIWELIK